MVERGRPPQADPPTDLVAAVLAVLVLQRGGQLVLTVEEVNAVLGTVMGIRLNEELGLIQIYIKSDSEESLN